MNNQWSVTSKWKSIEIKTASCTPNPKRFYRYFIFDYPQSFLQFLSRSGFYTPSKHTSILYQYHFLTIIGTNNMTNFEIINKVDSKNKRGTRIYVNGFFGFIFRFHKTFPQNVLLGNWVKNQQNGSKKIKEGAHPTWQIIE